MTELKVGDVVDITIKGARVVAMDMHGCVTVIAAEAHDGGAAHWRLPPQAAIEHVAPAEWPPRAGDLWREDHPDGTTWFAQRYLADFDNPEDYKGCNADGWRITLVPVNGGPYGSSDENPEQLVRKARLVLVHRDQAEAAEAKGGDR